MAPGCAGTVRAEAAVAPLQNGNRGVSLTLMFTAEQPDPSCALTGTASWRNVDTGAAGATDITVSSVPTPGRFETDHGYARTQADTGPGTVVVTFSTNPGEVTLEV
ncbi:hypothetical protein [Nocardia sp. NPDC003963]